MLAYVLLNIKPNSEGNVFAKVKEFDDVKEVHILFGSWDMILQVELDDVSALNEFMIEKIRKIPDVTLTATMLVAK